MPTRARFRVRISVRASAGQTDGRTDGDRELSLRLFRIILRLLGYHAAACFRCSAGDIASSYGDVDIPKLGYVRQMPLAAANV